MENENKPPRRKPGAVIFLLGILGIVFLDAAACLFLSRSKTPHVWLPLTAGIVFIAAAIWRARG